jgi:hypothetical protein
MEQYLRIFCNFKQNDWFQFLPLAEFTYNNSVNSSTKLMHFFADAGLNPLFDPAIPPSSTVPSAEHRVRKIKSTILTLRDTLAQAQCCYSHYANRSRLPVPDSFKVGGLVYLDRRNLTSTRPSKKLNDKKLGCFRISRVINEVAFELALPHSMQIHLVFHASLLEPAPADLCLLHSRPPPVIHDSSEYEVERILDMRVVRGTTNFLVHWKFIPPKNALGNLSATSPTELS